MREVDTCQEGVLSSFPWPASDRKESDYDEVKKALKDGQLQIRSPGQSEWKDYLFTAGVGFIFPIDCYRRKH